MPNIKSQKDRVVQAKKEAMHNKAIKSNLKTVIKKADAAIESNAADKETAIKAAASALNSAQSKGVIHKNTAARKISRMAKRANKAAAQLNHLNNARRENGGHFHFYHGHAAIYRSGTSISCCMVKL